MPFWTNKHIFAWSRHVMFALLIFHKRKSESIGWTVIICSFLYHGKGVNEFLVITHPRPNLILVLVLCRNSAKHDDVIKWKHSRSVTYEFPLQRPVRLSFAVFFDMRLNKRLSNSREVGDLRRHRTHYDVTVMNCSCICLNYAGTLGNIGYSPNAS